MNKINAEAYKEAFQAVFGEVKRHHKEFEVGKTLKGIIADWSDTQINGLELAIGKETTDMVIKGCQVSCHQ